MEHIATCRTIGCENAGIEIELIQVSELVVCGPCGEPITDITPQTPRGSFLYPI